MQEQQLLTIFKRKSDVVGINVGYTPLGRIFTLAIDSPIRIRPNIGTVLGGYHRNKQSVLNQRNELRERHFDFIKSELNRELESTIKGEFITKIT
jgi:hypothetical protein